MENVREQQVEAIKMASEYLDKLIPSMEQVIGEIKGERQDDTIDFLMQVVDGLNFMFETYNVTKELINEKEVLVNDDALQEAVDRMSDGFAKKDYEAIADELSESIVPFLKVYREAAKAV